MTVIQVVLHGRECLPLLSYPLYDINDDSDKEVAIVEAPVARSKCLAKTIKYYFSDDEYDD